MNIVVVGGCFDILHPGHIGFLESARKLGDKLVVLLESDLRVKQLKGQDRPINSQLKRRQALLALPFVNEVIKLPDNPNFVKILKEINPSIIAITTGDETFDRKQSAVHQLTNCRLISLPFLPGFSTSKIINNL